MARKTEINLERTDGIYCGLVDEMGAVCWPSVTTVISEFLSDFSKVPPAILERACLFGAAVHKATDLWDRGVLDMAALDENIRPCVAAWQQCKKENEIEIEASEHLIYSTRDGYAGTLDKMAMINGRRSLIEIKTRPYNHKTESLQAAAYVNGWNERYPDKLCKKSFFCELPLSGRYKFFEITGSAYASMHYAVFKSALTLFKWKRGNIKRWMRLNQDG